MVIDSDFGFLRALDDDLWQYPRMPHVQTLVIGGGIAGSSLACSLAQRGAGKGVAIVDADLYGRYSSSELNGGGVRCVFAEPVNIKLSLVSIEYYRKHASKFDFRQRGYLWMYDRELWEHGPEFLPIVRSRGVEVEEFDREELRRRFPFFDQLEDVAGVTFSPGDGRLSPHRLRMHYLNEAERGGVEMMDRWVVTSIAPKAHGWPSVGPYELKLKRIADRRVRTTLEDFSKASSEEITLTADRIVNAAGPWAAKIAKMYERNLPVEPVPRQVYLLDPCGIDFDPLPFFIDYPQELYFRHYDWKGQSSLLVSWSDPREQPRIDFSKHGEKYFEQHIKRRLVRRIPQLRDAKIITTWTGHYEMSADKHAIVGGVSGRAGIFNYCGLSAHGVMQSRALGEAMASLLTTGSWGEIDLTELTEKRFEKGRAVEKMYV